MPIYNQITPPIITKDKKGNQQAFPNFRPLTKNGFKIPVIINIPSFLQTYYAEKKIDCPKPITTVALIDTGASKTAICETIFTQKLKINPIDKIKILTPSGSEERNMYPCQLLFQIPSIENKKFNFAKITAVNLKAQDVDVLIGRDILNHCVLIYNGTTGNCSLSF